jgi:hypothetical protein
MTWKCRSPSADTVSIGFIELYDEEMCFEANPECESLAALQMQELEIKDEGKISSGKPLRINEYKYNNEVRAYALLDRIATQLFGIIDRFEDV